MRVQELSSGPGRRARARSGDGHLPIKLRRLECKATYAAGRRGTETSLLFRPPPPDPFFTKRLTPALSFLVVAGARPPSTSRLGQAGGINDGSRLVMREMATNRVPLVKNNVMDRLWRARTHATSGRDGLTLSPLV